MLLLLISVERSICMIDFTLNDFTQIEIKKHLVTTEKLLSRVVTKVSGTQKEATIYVLPDLGIASNKARMLGGFYTGLVASWNTAVPIIPVDATVNSCGVSVFKLKQHLTSSQFSQAIHATIPLAREKGFFWNFNVGNHFIIIGELSNGEPCVVLHASAQEFKKGNMQEGLYPEKGNWYFDDIETEFLEERFLRFISGKKAERFFEIAEKVKIYNQERHRLVAHFLFGDNLGGEMLNIQHYGMPSQNSVAIGCSWEGGAIPLLTAPNQKIYLVDPIKGGDNTITLKEERVLFPHGLGVYSKTGGIITYSQNDISVFGNRSEDTLTKPAVAIRCSDSSEIELDSMVKQITTICPATILDYIKPAHTYSKTETLLSA